MEVNINLIKKGDRFRKELGDIQSLADSIKELGLLQPIGIDSNYRLIFGERRLEACKLLKQEKIKARIIHLSDIVQGEYAENELRKDFTVTERLAIMDSIKTAGQGSRTDLQPRQNFAEVKTLAKKEDAAKQAGLGNKETARQAKKVVEKALPEVVKKMDSNEVAISTAAKIADLPEQEQKAVVNRIEQGVKPSEAIKSGTATAAYQIKVNSPEPENLYEQVKELVIEKSRSSVTMVARIKKISVDRATELFEQLVDDDVLTKTPTGYELQHKQDNNKTVKPNDLNNDFKLRIEHIVSLSKSWFLQTQPPKLEPVNEENDHVFQTSYFAELKKIWNDQVFYKPNFSNIEHSLFDDIKNILAETGNNGSVIIVPCRPTEDYFIYLSNFSDYICLPQYLLHLKNHPGALDLGGKGFTETTIAVFINEDQKSTVNDPGFMFGRLGGVWQ